MKIERNITQTPSGTYKVRIIRDYLRARVQRNFKTLPEARAWRDAVEGRCPITSVFYRRPAKA